ncbi:MBL fold metallo-hydrolase [Paraburkholderia sp. 31.1]|uniref:ComEC/Rec2 family competence protein n=1 Tax=Paraburkholderia sp. 31.1 TaxID=2615205 RepID=UPI001655EE31|nr:MBL fold metallo-hydrolase [Paraburkholderia sp. 31.1]MBC8725816.1 MBL fold metallo-hydrolase [Paraburkholderia sp. 31.1]
MADSYELDFLAVETDKSGDAIAIRYTINGTTGVHVIDGGYLDTGDQLVAHIKEHYGVAHVDHVVLTHPDQDHANGLRKILEEFSVGTLWINRPWIYADLLLPKFGTYNSVDALRNKLRSAYAATAALEELAVEKGIPIREPLQGAQIGPFHVLAPSLSRYLDLVVTSNKTPEAVQEVALAGILNGLFKAAKSVTNFIKGAWGFEVFPEEGTSNENEMSVVQYALLDRRRVLLTGDAGREALTEAANYAPYVGLQLPGIHDFQVPHHGGRHNVNTEVLDRWLGPRLSGSPAQTTWRAVCSSAKADEHHPRKAVVRAMIHRGAWFGATEGSSICLTSSYTRPGWNWLPQTMYPTELEE